MQHQNNSENNSYNFDVWAGEVKRQLLAVLNKKKSEVTSLSIISSRRKSNG
jgi:hypothetical protein